MVVEIQGKRREREVKEKKEAVKDDMLRWDLSDEDVVDRIRWQSQTELGALHGRHTSRNRKK